MNGLPRAREDLQGILRVMRERVLRTPNYRLEYSEDADQEHLENPRQFCFVTPDNWVIYCSRAIEDVSPNVRIAILLHEIGHLHCDAFLGDESEVDVDTWVLQEFPDAGYTYMNHRFYSQVHGDDVVAKNVQHVHDSFVNEVQK